jgi:hypothetical protein
MSSSALKRTVTVLSRAAIWNAPHVRTLWDHAQRDTGPFGRIGLDRQHGAHVALGLEHAARQAAYQVHDGLMCTV